MKKSQSQTNIKSTLPSLAKKTIKQKVQQRCFREGPRKKMRQIALKRFNPTTRPLLDHYYYRAVRCSIIITISTKFQGAQRLQNEYIDKKILKERGVHVALMHFAVLWSIVYEL